MKTRLFCLILALLPVAAAAQTVTGEIRGTVRDSSGGVLPGVTVTATNTQTGLTRTIFNPSGHLFETIANTQAFETCQSGD